MKAVIFDMDGVLFDTESMSSKAWYQLAEEMKLGDISEAAVGCIGRNRADIVAMFLKLYGNDFPVEEFLNRSIKMIQQWIKEKGLPVMPGAPEILAYLKENGYTVALASSSSTKTVLSHLERSGLTDFFQSVTGGNQVTHSKPLPDIYLKACASINANPVNTIAVEDSPNGIRSAYAAGMKPVMIPDLIQPDEEIKKLIYQKYDSLSELQKAFEKALL